MVQVSATAGVEGKLFGSVTLQQVAELLEEKGISVDRRKLSVVETIKSVGEHSVDLRLHRELVATFKVVVVAEDAEAAGAAEATETTEATES